MINFYFKCPKCKNNENFVKISQKSSILTFIVLFLGGFFPALFHGFHRVRRVQCTKCRHIFQQPRIPQSPVSRLSAWLLIILILSAAIILVFKFFPQISYEIPNHQYLSMVYDFVRSNSKGISIALLFMIPLIFLLITFAAIINNYKFKKEFKTRYKVIPESDIPLSRPKNMETNNSYTPDSSQSVDNGTTDYTPSSDQLQP